MLGFKTMFYEWEKSVWIRVVSSADRTDVQYTECGSTGRTGDSAGQPGLRSLLVLAASEPSTQTGQTPHGSAETLLALGLVTGSYEHTAVTASESDSHRTEQP